MHRRTRSVLSKGTGKGTSARLSKTDASGRWTLPTAQPLLPGSSVCYLSGFSWKPHRSLKPRVFRLELHLPCSAQAPPRVPINSTPPHSPVAQAKTLGVFTFLVPSGDLRAPGPGHTLFSQCPPSHLGPLSKGHQVPAQWLPWPEVPTHLPSTHCYGRSAHHLSLGPGHSHCPGAHFQQASHGCSSSRPQLRHHSLRKSIP